MSSFKWKANFASALILIALVRPEFSFAQTQTSFPQLDQHMIREPFSAESLSEDLAHWFTYGRQYASSLLPMTRLCPPAYETACLIVRQRRRFSKSSTMLKRIEAKL